MSVFVTNDAVARQIGGYTNSIGADDTDPAFTIVYDGDETSASVSVHSVVANTMRLIYGSTTTDFDLSNAAYNTYGELADAVNALAGWNMTLVAVTRADNTYSSNLKIIAFGATSCKTAAGVTGYVDTSNALFRSMVVGVEQISANLDGGTIPQRFRTSTNTIPYSSDPTYDNYSPDDGTPKYSAGYGAQFLGGTFVGAIAGGAYAAWTITPCTQAVDGTAFTYADTAGTTGVKSVIGSDQIGGSGIVKLGGRLVVKVSAQGQAITSSTLSVNGNILYCGGI